jgi:hypothetical protein
MSALSVMSMIVPTATGGTAAASVETAADDGLFAGLIAAAAPSPMAQGEAGDETPVLDGAPVESATLDNALVAAPAWAPVPLIAPAALPVAPTAQARGG